MSINTKATQLTQDQQMIAGIKKHSSTVSSWVIAGKTYTAQQALDILQARVTDRDLAMAAYTQGRPLSQIPVSSAMAKQVHGVHEKDSLDAVEAVLRRARVRRVPVLDGDGTLKGILSMNDLARHAHSSAGRRGDGPSSASIVQTMAAICEPQIPADAKGPAANGRAVQPTA